MIAAGVTFLEQAGLQVSALVCAAESMMLTAAAHVTMLWYVSPAW
jgi:hypothetical protein